MKKRNDASDGWDLADFFVVIIFVVLIVSIIITHCSDNANEENLKVQARKFAQDFDLQVISVSCASYDSTCTIRYEESAGIIKTMALECADESLGCKQPKRKLRPGGKDST